MQARVLDISKAEGIVDLSLRPQLITPVVQASRPARGKRKAPLAEPADPAVRLSCCVWLYRTLDILFSCAVIALLEA